MYFYRKRLNAESCLKHPWINSISASQQERDLSANKQNIKNVPKNNKYYLFDAASKTMSVASNDIGESYERFFRKRALVKYHFRIV